MVVLHECAYESFHEDGRFFASSSHYPYQRTSYHYSQNKKEHSSSSLIFTLFIIVSLLEVAKN